METQKVEKLLRADDVADRLNISRVQAYRLMKSDLPCVRFGGATVRVRPADLEAYIQNHLTGGAA